MYNRIILIRLLRENIKLENLLLKPRTLENVKIFLGKSQDEEVEAMFPFNRNTLDEAVKMYEESLKPGARSLGKIIYFDDKYIGDIWCYGIDEVVDNRMGKNEMNENIILRHRVTRY